MAKRREREAKKEAKQRRKELEQEKARRGTVIVCKWNDADVMCERMRNALDQHPHYFEYMYPVEGGHVFTAVLTETQRWKLQHVEGVQTCEGWQGESL